MRVLFLAHRVPYAPNRGDRSRAYHLLQRLRAAADVDLVCFAHDAHESRQDVGALASRASILRLPAHGNPLRVIRALSRGSPLTHALLHSGRMRSVLDRIVESRPPDVVLAYCSGMARFAMEPPLDAFPFVMDLVDVDSRKWHDLAGWTRGLRRWVYGREARVLALFEAAAARRAFLTLVVNDREKEALQRLVPDARVAVLPNGTDVSAFRPPAVRCQANRVVFCGVMSYSPNRDAALWLAREIWPAVRRSVPGASLCLAGANPCRRVRALAVKDPSVHVTGSLADIRPELWRSSVAVAPLRQAWGLQSKVLEALAAGLPCVITPTVRDGLPPSVLPACVTAADAVSFRAAIVDLLQKSPRQREAIAARAPLWALDWDHSASELVSVLNAAARAPNHGAVEGARCAVWAGGPA